MSIKDLIAGRFMRAASLQTVMKSSIDYCSYMGEYGGWGVSFGTQVYDRYGVKSKDLLNVTIRKIEKVKRLSDVKDDMSNKANKINVYCHFDDGRIDFVSVFYHERSLAFGFITRQAYEHYYSALGDFEEDLHEQDFTVGLYEQDLSDIVSFGMWYSIDSGNEHIISRVSMVIALMVEFDISVEAAISMMSTQKTYW